jgi:hypothetical protein
VLVSDPSTALVSSRGRPTLCSYIKYIVSYASILLVAYQSIKFDVVNEGHWKFCPQPITCCDVRKAATARSRTMRMYQSQHMRICIRIKYGHIYIWRDNVHMLVKCCYSMMLFEFVDSFHTRFEFVEYLIK